MRVIAGLFKKSVVVQQLLRSLRPYSKMRPDWSWLAVSSGWSEARRNACGGPRVLIATSTGSNWPCSSVESMLGVALTLRGAEVYFLLCDGILAACQECDHQWVDTGRFVAGGPQINTCASCFSPASAMLSPIGLPLLRYSQFAPDLSSRLSGRGEDVAMLEHARAGALRYFGRGTLPEDNGETVLGRYLQAAEMTSAVIERVAASIRPDVAVFHHGIYVPQGVVGKVLRNHGVRVVNWGPAYRKSTVLFSHGDSYHHTMVAESPEQWSDLEWSSAEQAQIMRYLDSRWTGSNDWISFQAGAELDDNKIAERLGLDRSRPIIGLLTNVIWDAQLHFRQSAFSSMLEWMFASISYFIERPDLQLVIRVHPAEVMGSVPSRQRAADEIARRFGKLPGHIKIVGPEEKISTYSLMALCDSALVYGTKTALELACSGLPVVVAGEAWCRGKGFTIDVSSPDEYLQVLHSLPLKNRLTSQQVDEARKYAFHFFFRRMIPLRNLTPMKRFGPYSVNVSNLDELRPGRDPGLDVVCNGILDGCEFVFRS